MFKRLDLETHTSSEDDHANLTQSEPVALESIDENSDDEDDSVRIMAMLSDAIDECADDANWCQWFCSLPENEGFVLIDEEYLQDDFNLVGLSKFVPQIHKVLNYMLDQESTDSEDSIDSSQDSDDGESLKMSAIVLYGLVHARFLMTNKGMSLALEKYQQKVYGTCPNVSCKGQLVMPIGVSDALFVESVKVFCPRCNDMYHPTNGDNCWVAGNDIDGSFFGTSFAPAFFLRAIPSVIPRPLGMSKMFVPKVYGFRVHPGERNRYITRCFRRQALLKQQKLENDEHVQSNDMV